ncbi:alkyl sulfatase C-terminal domain-containing protein [Shewanella atlantica]|uniref:alkyl sulfatase C-terminal domain-containing protein n=1 Tax=Shewanella atlantica TaxID=271099 RepID=UPI003735DC2B
MALSADATLNISHELFIELVIGSVGLSDLLFSGEMSIEGSKLGLVNFLTLLDKPEGVFNIVTP